MVRERGRGLREGGVAWEDVGVAYLVCEPINMWVRTVGSGCGLRQGAWFVGRGVAYEVGVVYGKGAWPVMWV